MATSKRPLCVCVAQVRGKVSGKDESLLIVGVGWACHSTPGQSQVDAGQLLIDGRTPS